MDSSESEDLESKNSETEITESENSEINDTKKKNSKLKKFKLNQYILLAITSFLFAIGTFIGGFIIQRKIEKKIIPSMINYIPHVLFSAFYIISGVVHIISCLYVFLKTRWYLSLTIFLRLLAIVTGLFSIYLNYSKKDGIIHKIEDVWFQDSYSLIVSYYQDYFNCCGWNTTTASCSYTRCYDFVNDQIDEIAKMIGIASFVINTFQVGLCVDSILDVALQIESSSKKSNKNNDKYKDKNKKKDNKKDNKKDGNKQNANKKLQKKNNLSQLELDENTSNTLLSAENNNESGPLIQEDKNKQKNKKRKLDTILIEDDNLNDNELDIIDNTQSDLNQSNLSLADISSNTQNTQNSINEISGDKIRNRSKNKKAKEPRNKKSRNSSDEMELELITDSNYK